MVLSGCLTELTYQSVVGSKSDLFSPLALYKSKAGNNLAIEGTLTKSGERNGVRAYLIIPEKVLVAAHIKTGGDVSFKDISSLAPDLRKELRLRNKLGAGYEKVADIPQNRAGMAVNQRTTVNLRIAKWLPFAFIIDAVSFPLELYFLHKMPEQFIRG